MEVALKKRKAGAASNLVSDKTQATSRLGTAGKRKRKVLERVLISVAVIVTMVVVILYNDLFERYAESSYPESAIYGTWVEKDVASYTAETFVVNEQGILVNGRIVATRFDYDGSYLEYTYGGEEYRFRFQNDSRNQMSRVSNAHYNPVFELKGKVKTSLR